MVAPHSTALSETDPMSSRLIGLTIRDIVLIDRLELELGHGLVALTGETGAGKSILLDALGLALGARADKGLVRHGAEQGMVVATFQVPLNHPLDQLLADQMIERDDDLIILRRSLTADGRGRAYVNDRPVGVALLREIGEQLVEIHGQQDTHGLLDAAHHLDLLDAYAGVGALADQVAAAWREVATADQAVRSAQAELDRSAAEEDYLRHVVAELTELDAQPGEQATLANERALLQQAGKLLEGLESALTALSGDQGAETRLRQAERAVERVAAKIEGRFDQALAAVRRAAEEAGEALAQVEESRRGLELDPRRLDALEERLFALRAMARKHRVDTDALVELTETVRRKLDLIERGESRIGELSAAATAARARYRTLAESLSERRRAAAGRLDQLVMAELPPLKLERARFVTDLHALPDHDWSAKGMERVAFLVSTNPGTPPGPLDKIASGGELSRFMLALKVVLAETTSAGSLVFDEVDAGIGGATADAVGERLARLALGAQILVVTHSPQVAARANRQLYIWKEDHNGTMRTQIRRLDESERREEIARMLAGATITPEARAAAARLLEAAAA